MGVTCATSLLPHRFMCLLLGYGSEAEGESLMDANGQGPHKHAVTITRQLHHGPLVNDSETSPVDAA